MAYVMLRRTSVGMTLCVLYRIASVGWLVGKNKMRNWRAAVRTWKARSAKEGKYDNSQRPAGRKSRRRDYAHLPRQGNGSGAGPPAGVTVLKA